MRSSWERRIVQGIEIDQLVAHSASIQVDVQAIVETSPDRFGGSRGTVMCRIKNQSPKRDRRVGQAVRSNPVPMFVEDRKRSASP
jgi:O6-methylguanine-DNA--protein-cysteine methyltransferase